jgi:hypothetical protein
VLTAEPSTLRSLLWVFCLWPMSPNRKRPVWFLLTQHSLSLLGVALYLSSWPTVTTDSSKLRSLQAFFRARSLIERRVRVGFHCIPASLSSWKNSALETFWALCGLRQGRGTKRKNQVSTLCVQRLGTNEEVASETDDDRYHSQFATALSPRWFPEIARLPLSCALPRMCLSATLCVHSATFGAGSK